MQCALNVDFRDVRGSSAGDDAGRPMANMRATKGVNVVFMIFKALGELPETRPPTCIVGLKLPFCNYRSELLRPLRLEFDGHAFTNVTDS